MGLYQNGTLNTTALTVAGVYVNIVPPQNAVINGVPTNNLGVVGTATWGPVNVPTDFGTYAQGAGIFGQMQARQYDLMTCAYAATLQGANYITGVRVTDGTDTAASAVLTATGTAITFTAKYSGTFGNGIQVTLQNGSAVNSYAVQVAAPGLTGERFDNIIGTGNALWLAIAAAINNGKGALRGPSQIITATAGAGTGTPTLATSTLSGGTDGTTTITATTLIGQDTSPRKGMYALRAQNCGVITLADACDPTQWTLQEAFGDSEGVYMIDSCPSGGTIATAATALSTAGIDNAWMKVMVGDWCQINDTVNQVNRYISPNGFAAGRKVNQAPQFSLLNAPINGIIGTQKSITGQNYTPADIQAAVAGRVDLIANPSPGGTYFSCQTGNNTSSNGATNGDNYTTMTDYIAVTINQGSGQFIGGTNLQGSSANDPYRAKVKAGFDTLFLNMFNAGQIAAWQTTCDLTNNTSSSIAQGYCVVNIAVTYLSVVRYLIVNVQGGQIVSIQSSTTPLAA